ncbi:glycosyltransferase family 4 protein [Tateyamaria armeniaca]|uniref:Glycosyltransferase family 4 protein n=1 Tax=Tateyamaria armeniaca TaxID=2518930 RepID=A0ABW8UQB9_9RHOB
MRRSGKVLTGVDRVELAYLTALLQDAVPVFGLIRSKIGYILLDQAGLAELRPYFSAPNASADTHHRDTWRCARRCSIGRVPPVLLKPMLGRKMPAGFAYLNVGHSNLTERVLRTMRALDARITVLIHDVIPLDFPEFQRAGTVQPFAQMIARVGAYADLMIYNSQDTKMRTEAHLPVPPQAIVSHLGTDVAAPAPDDIPAGLPIKAPFFVSIGTIEPRKNHAFLLDIWAEMGPDAPGLILAGGRGWNNEAVFARLDALQSDGPVREVAGLSDGALAALVERSAGVLFPTHAEGFGLPATEAAARGVPVIVNDLPVMREILGDIPIYASVSDRYLWINKIKELASRGPDASKQQPFVPPKWDAHFKTVLRLT